MGSPPRLLAALPVAGILAAAVAVAGTPDPNLSTVPNVVTSPGAESSYTVTVIGSQGPLAGSLVRVVYSDEADQLLCWCPGQAHPVIEATTDANGQATFLIGAGGCLDPAQFAAAPVQVFADGILLAEVGSLSPDAVDAEGLLPEQGWNPAGICSVTLTDAVFHTPPIASGIYNFCTDFNSDGVVDLEDAVLVTGPIKRGDTCGP